METKRVPEVGQYLWPDDPQMRILVTKIEGGIVYGENERGNYEIAVAGLLSLNPPISIQ